jgi:hypothetical protein
MCGARIADQGEAREKKVSDRFHMAAKIHLIHIELDPVPDDLRRGKCVNRAQRAVLRSSGAVPGVPATRTSDTRSALSRFRLATPHRKCDI